MGGVCLTRDRNERGVRETGRGRFVALAGLARRRRPPGLGSQFEVGAAKGLFRLRVMERAGFDVLPRGLVMIGPEGGRTGEVEVVLNYLEEVRALAGGTRRR